MVVTGEWRRILQKQIAPSKRTDEAKERGLRIRKATLEIMRRGREMAKAKVRKETA